MLYFIKLRENKVSLLEYDSDMKKFVTKKKNGEEWQEYHEDHFWQWFKGKIEDDEPLSLIVDADKGMLLDSSLNISNKNIFEKYAKDIVPLLDNPDMLVGYPTFDPKFIKATTKYIAEKEKAYTKGVLEEVDIQLEKISEKLKHSFTKETAVNALEYVDTIKNVIDKKRISSGLGFLKRSIGQVNKKIHSTIDNLQYEKELEEKRIRESENDVYHLVEPFLKDDIVFLKDGYYYCKEHSLCIYLDNEFIKDIPPSEMVQGIRETIEYIKKQIYYDKERIESWMKNGFENISLEESFVSLSLLWIGDSEYVSELDESILKKFETDLLKMIKKSLYKLWITKKASKFLHAISEKTQSRVTRNSLMVLDSTVQRSYPIGTLTDLPEKVFLNSIGKTKKLSYAKKPLSDKEHFLLLLKNNFQIKSIDDKRYIKLMKLKMKEE